MSLLSRATLAVGGSEAGSCVDAMAGEKSGQIAYVIVTEGGVAGVGERLFKLPWRDARMDGEHLMSDRAEALEEVEKDEWPGR